MGGDGETSWQMLWRDEMGNADFEQQARIHSLSGTCRFHLRSTDSARGAHGTLRLSSPSRTLTSRRVLLRQHLGGGSFIQLILA